MTVQTDGADKVWAKLKLLKYIALNFDTDKIEEHGLFFWTTKRGKRSVGDLAGNVNRDGYIDIHLLKKNHKAHRLVWLWVHGKWPDDQIDHVNGLTTDNRISNLRDVTPAENSRNRRLSKNNISGVTGVRYDKVSDRWTVCITIPGGCGKFYKSFKNKLQAIKCARAKYLELGYSPRHGM